MVRGWLENSVLKEIGRYGCQDDGLDEANAMMREGGREGGTYRDTMRSTSCGCSMRTVSGWRAM